ncbi:acetyl-CoA C-acetyltransferase [Nakamurella deserti]|uniref:acetyl-CoA C-acetyltransferase n=1 Tax=Nakamurella deserti TaxID=2164074 RepID=UPI000DBE4CEB|nr:acetyl-CoA C-acetyltransferase [Nakamurella deserti]
MAEAVIVATARSPIGRAFKGSLAGIRADDLMTQVVQALLDEVPALDPTTVDDLFVGAWDQAGEHAENMARRIAVQLGYDHLPAVMVNRACASSVQTARMAANAIAAGDGDVFISGGVESISRYSRQTRVGSGDPDLQNPMFRAAQEVSESYVDSNETWHDPRTEGQLPDIYLAMGQTAENVATYCGVTREEQDAFALASQQRAAAAVADGFFAREITPIMLPDGSAVTTDDSPRPSTTADGLAALKPVFRAQGTITAGNACPLNDGAAAVLIMSDVRARELGLTPLARIVATAASALSPEIMGLGPVDATRRVLAKAGLGVDDIDLFEINEAFAAQVIPSYRQLGIDPAKLNVHGGAIALGHPFGSTGARIMTTLINGLRSRDEQFGVETMCVGGGQGMAIVLERLS